MTRLRYNGLNTGAAGATVTLALGASLTSGATAVTFNAALTHSNGTAVPTIASPDYIPLSILDANGHVSEIVWLTAYTAGATTGTIARGQEATAGVAHSSGDKIVHGMVIRDLLLDGLVPDVLHSTYGDHFAAASLDAKWTRQTFTSTGEAFQQGEERAWPGTDTNMQNVQTVSTNSYYYQSAPAGDFTVLMRSSFIGASNMFGPLILDNSGNGVGATVYNSPEGYLVGSIAAGVYSSTNQSVARPTVSAYTRAGGPTWFRLNKTGTAYKASVSFNGRVWLPYTATITSAITPTRIGFGNFFGTNSLTSMSVDWFDVQ